MPVTKREVGGIVRVSSKRQAVEGESPANQRHILESQGATRFYEYVGSGYNAERRRASQAWQALIQDIQQGRLHKLLAVDISRAARKDELLTELIELCDASGVEFLASGHQLSHGTSMQWYSAKQMALLAELYSRELSDKIKRGQKAALERGVPAVTSRHLPWHLMREPGTRHGVIPHPERWDDARAVVMDYIEGHSGLDALSSRIYKKHGTMGCAAAMHKWLRGHAIQGHYGKRGGEVLLYNCFPALISVEEAELLHRRLKLNAKRWGTSSNHTVYALTGLCRCLHCDKALSYSVVKKHNRRDIYHYMRCNSRRECPGFRRVVHAEMVEEAILWQLNRALLAKRSATINEPTPVHPEVAALRNRISTMEQLLTQLDTPGVRSDLKQAQERLDALEASLQKHGSKRVDIARELLMGSDNAFMARPQGKRNADLMALLEVARVDPTYQPEGPSWQTKLVRELVLR